MSSVRKFTFAISSPDKFLVPFPALMTRIFEETISFYLLELTCCVAVSTFVYSL